MSLRLRLALLISLIAGAALLLAGMVVNRGVVRPFSEEVFSAFIDEAAYAADRVESGEEPKTLGRAMGLHIRALPELEEAPEGWQRVERGGREIAFRKGQRKAAVAVRAGEGWVLVRRSLDLDAPGRRIRLALLWIGAAVVASALWISRAATRPLDEARQAMERVAAGDLEWRLPERGPPELAALARTYNAMTRRVAELLAAEKSLMAGISHELRTPMTRLRLEVELLKDLGAGASIERRLGAMEGDLAEMDGLIAELLEISRLQIGQQKLELEALTLDEVAREALRRCPLPNHEVLLTGESETLQGDRERLVRAVANLLQNAEKYTPKGTQLKVTLSARALEVADSGPGVPEPDLARIFEPFYRRDSQQTPGFGLGLMIAREVVRLHGGTISAQNQEGGGLRVRIEL